MTKRAKLSEKVLREGNPANIKFSELQAALRAEGFIHDRTTGSHEIWINKEKALSLNIQPMPKNKAMAKAYQVREFREIMKGTKQ